MDLEYTDEQMGSSPITGTQTLIHQFKLTQNWRLHLGYGRGGQA